MAFVVQEVSVVMLYLPIFLSYRASHGLGVCDQGGMIGCDRLGKPTLGSTGSERLRGRGAGSRWAVIVSVGTAAESEGRGGDDVFRVTSKSRLYTRRLIYIRDGSRGLRNHGCATRQTTLLTSFPADRET